MLARYFKNDGNGAAIGKGEFVRAAEPLVRPRALAAALGQRFAT
jgi:hypothetical protein